MEDKTMSKMENFKEKAANFYEEHKWEIGYVTGAVVAFGAMGLCQKLESRKMVKRGFHHKPIYVNKNLFNVLKDADEKYGTNQLRFAGAHGTPIDPADLGKLGEGIVENYEQVGIAGSEFTHFIAIGQAK
jgi:hypothetical protein